MTDGKKADDQLRLIPALFATIHWRSPRRPNGYTPEQVEELNRMANAHLPAGQKDKVAESDEDPV